METMAQTGKEPTFCMGNDARRLGLAFFGEILVGRDSSGSRLARARVSQFLPGSWAVGWLELELS